MTFFFFTFPFRVRAQSHTPCPFTLQKRSCWNVTDCSLRPRSKMYVFTQTDEVLRQSSVYLIFVLIQKLFSWQSNNNNNNVEHILFCIIAELCLRATFKCVQSRCEREWNGSVRLRFYLNAFCFPSVGLWSFPKLYWQRAGIKEYRFTYSIYTVVCAAYMRYISVKKKITPKDILNVSCCFNTENWSE